MPFISLDIEATGPIPGLYDMISLGAVKVLKTEQGYEPSQEEIYLEIQPVYGGVMDEAMAVHGLDLDEIKAHGMPFQAAAERLRTWALAGSTRKDPPVFVGYCANFDWSFVNDMYLRTGIENPFGYKALDLRALAMGVLRLPWLNLSQDTILPRLGLAPLSAEDAHNALADARHQAGMLCRLLALAELEEAIRLP